MGLEHWGVRVPAAARAAHRWHQCPGGHGNRLVDKRWGLAADNTRVAPKDALCHPGSPYASLKDSHHDGTTVVCPKQEGPIGQDGFERGNFGPRQHFLQGNRRSLSFNLIF